MPADRHLMLVASGPGRSGADTLLRMVSRHPAIAVPSSFKPSLVAAIGQLLVYGACDGEAWLPRRAAQALTQVASCLEAIGAAGRRAAVELQESAGVVPVDIPVYGRLLLPAELPAARWTPLIRQALFAAAAAPDRICLALKTGPWFSPVICSLLRPEDSLVCTVRHPAETVIGLTESRVDGMRAAEAADYVDIHLGHTRRVLAAAPTPAILIRLEDLVLDADDVLARLTRAAGLQDVADWTVAARAGLPRDVSVLPRWDHPAVRPRRADLAALARLWGYR